MDKNLLNRLEKLEERSDLGDPRTASTEALLAYVTEWLGYAPTDADLERLVAEGEAVEGPKE